MASNHIDMDSTCSNPHHTPLKLAAWAVLSATTGQQIAVGHLHGLLQRIDRAELCAMLVALRWVAHHDADSCLWSDSLSTVRTTLWILRADLIPPGIANYDLWLQVREELHMCDANRLWIHWIPSHLDPLQAENPMEDWIALWNNNVDALAALTNEQRPSEFRALTMRIMLT